jgi:hypothetical protein
LKYAIIKPIFKKGDDQEIINYSPISLVSSFSKLLKNLFMLDFLIT